MFIPERFGLQNGEGVLYKNLQLGSLTYFNGDYEHCMHFFFTIKRYMARSKSILNPNLNQQHVCCSPHQYNCIESLPLRAFHDITLVIDQGGTSTPWLDRGCHVMCLVMTDERMME